MSNFNSPAVQWLEFENRQIWRSIRLLYGIFIVLFIAYAVVLFMLLFHVRGTSNNYRFVGMFPGISTRWRFALHYSL